MAFIDTTPASFTPKVTESDFQPRLADLLATQGWTIAANFKKVVWDARLTKPNTPLTPSTMARFTVAEHFIYANKAKKMFGLAIVGTWEQTIGSLKEINKLPKPDNLEEIGVWATNEFRKYRAPHTMYVYMVEQLKELKPNGDDIVLGWQGKAEDQLRAALDIEVESSRWAGETSSPRFEVTKAAGGRMQSPIIQGGLRTNLLEQYFSEDYGTAVQYTNWWHDSEISIKGNLSEDSFFFILQCDNVPAPEGNLVPSIPFHFGKLDALEEGDEPYALFAGSVPFTKNSGSSLETQLKSIAEYDYDDTTTRMPNIMPLMKSYPKFPANGLDNIMINRSKLGARYQSHYLSWNAPANEIPPARTSEDGKRDYPRAWNNAENPLYKYSFNPSRYSQKVHTSKVYVIHPEEGVRGSLKDTIALSALSFHANKLRVKKTNCPDEFDVFRYFLVEGVSPFTKKPGTQYRPAGIGLYHSSVDKNGTEINTESSAKKSKK
ncbi:hypothetical protein [Brevibacillus laterosporus]|uniref:hypothetical protein n=1 Tax=Brevibacillus laterosporus TaxID=1465 RepID=UPI0018CDEA78|nr:hypothetical protein [Brevibacillus laterosporus]MBG9790441.1 hypothetical protein [Brevibacillus laterosporus]